MASFAGADWVGSIVGTIDWWLWIGRCADLLGVLTAIVAVITYRTIRSRLREVQTRVQGPSRIQALASMYEDFGNAGADRHVQRKHAANFLELVREFDAQVGEDKELKSGLEALTRFVQGNMDQVDPADVFMHTVLEKLKRKQENSLWRP